MSLKLEQTDRKFSRHLNGQMDRAGEDGAKEIKQREIA